MTEQQNFEVKQQHQETEEQNKMATLMIEILNHIQEKNLQYIQNQQDSQEDLECKRRDLRRLIDEYEKKLRDNNERIINLEKLFQQQQRLNNTLQNSKNKGSNKISMGEGEELDMEKIGKFIVELNREIKVSQVKQPLKYDSKDFDSKEIHKATAEIEKTLMILQDLKKDISKKPDLQTNFLEPLERKIKDREKRNR